MTPNGREVIRAGYAAGLPVPVIASQCDSTPGSVKVIAYNMGLRHPYKVHLRVPPHKLYDYRILRTLGKYSAPEAAAVLGLEAGL